MLTQLSNELADVVSTAAPSIVQVQGRRRPGTGLVYAEEVVLTTMRALGREDGLRVKRHDGQVLDAEFAGWDVATTLALLRVPGLGAPVASVSTAAPRVGQLAVALARSWSNATTASLGLVAVIGGPLRTSRRHAIDEVIRVSAPMHDGFSGGALLDTDGGRDRGHDGRRDPRPRRRDSGADRLEGRRARAGAWTRQPRVYLGVSRRPCSCPITRRPLGATVPGR